MRHEQLRFYRDREGTPRAEGFDEAARVLALFLESDVQDDAGLCRELLGRMAALSVDAEPVEFIGNSFAAAFGADAVALQGHSEGNSHSAILDPHRVELALRGWLEFIEA